MFRPNALQINKRLLYANINIVIETHKSNILEGEEVYLLSEKDFDVLRAGEVVYRSLEFDRE